MTTAEIKKQPIRPALKLMRRGTSVRFSKSRMESVYVTVSRLNTVYAPKKWATSIDRDDAGNEYIIVKRVN